MKTVFLSFIIFSLFSGVFNSKDIKTPEPVFPQNDFNVGIGEINFVWTASGKDLMYEILISNDSTFAENIRYYSSDTSKKIILTQFIGKTYWKVRAFKNNDKFSEWSKTVSFNLLEIAPCGKIGGCGTCKSPCGRRTYYYYDPN